MNFLSLSLLFSRLLYIIICLGLLGSLSGSTNQPQQSDDITLEFWHIQGQPGRIPPPIPALDFIQDSIIRYEHDHPNVQIHATTLVNDDYKSEISHALENGTAPCIFPTWGGGPLAALVKNGKIVDLTSWTEQNHYQDRFYSGSLSYVTIDGKIWGVPVENISVALIFYNEEIFKLLDLTPPTTYTELLAIVDRLVNAGYVPFALANETGWPGSMHFMYLVDRLGGPEIFQRAADRTGGSFEDLVFVQAGQMLLDLVKRGAFGNNATNFNNLNYDHADSRAELYTPLQTAEPSSNAAVMELMGSWTLQIIRDETQGPYDPEGLLKNIGFFPYPPIEGGRGDPNNLIGSIGDQFYHVAATCQHPREAFEFIQYLIDDEAVKVREQHLRIPPLRNLQLQDPQLTDIMQLVSRTPHIQLWYDQYLPTELGETHKNLIYQLMGLSITPQEAARQMETAAVTYYGG